MDFVNKFTGGGNKDNANTEATGQQQSSSGGGGFLDGITNKVNSAAGGGKESEKNEDYLDKGIASHTSLPSFSIVLSRECC
jgi:hypothetical protein